MNGPQHYREAERLIQARVIGDTTYPPTPEAIALAQVHATLATGLALMQAHIGSDVNTYWGAIIRGES